MSSTLPQDDFDLFCRIANAHHDTPPGASPNLLQADAPLNRYRSRSVREPRSRRHNHAGIDDPVDSAGVVTVVRRGSLRPDVSPHMGVRMPVTTPNTLQVANQNSGAAEGEEGQQLVRVRSFKRTSKGVVSQGDHIRHHDQGGMVATGPLQPPPTICMSTAGPGGSRRSSRDASPVYWNRKDQRTSDAGMGGGALMGGGGLMVPGTEGRQTRSMSCSPVPGLHISTESLPRSAPYQIQVIGAPRAGKSTLCRQFRTSEYLGARPESANDEEELKLVTVEVDSEESQLIFIDPPDREDTDAPMSVEILEDVDAYMIVYALDDRFSFEFSQRVLNGLFGEIRRSAALLLVATKADLVRGRDITTEEGKNLASLYNCKFMEVSTTLNHRVDELLVTLVTQIRHQLRKVEREKSKLDKKHRSSFRSSLRIKSPRVMLSKFMKKHFNKSAEDLNGL